MCQRELLTENISRETGGTVNTAAREDLRTGSLDMLNNNNQGKNSTVSMLCVVSVIRVDKSSVPVGFIL